MVITHVHHQYPRYQRHIKTHNNNSDTQQRLITIIANYKIIERISTIISETILLELLILNVFNSLLNEHLSLRYFEKVYFFPEVFLEASQIKIGAAFFFVQKMLLQESRYASCAPSSNFRTTHQPCVEIHQPCMACVFLVCICVKFQPSERLATPAEDPPLTPLYQHGLLPNQGYADWILNPSFETGLFPNMRINQSHDSLLSPLFSFLFVTPFFIPFFHAFFIPFVDPFYIPFCHAFFRPFLSRLFLSLSVTPVQRE